MTVFKKMYISLLEDASRVIDILQKNRVQDNTLKLLKESLYKAEDIYIEMRE